MFGPGLRRRAIPDFDRRYVDLIYQPQLQLMNFCARTAIASSSFPAAALSFMRAWAEDVYGIPPEQVIGTQRTNGLRT